MNLATIAELMAAAAGPAAVAAGRAATQSVIAPVTRTLTVSTVEPAARQSNRKRARAGRAKAIDAEVPQLLDLLAVASSAGLSAPLALRRAAEAVYGPLADELSQVLRASDLGARWRDELAAMAARTGSADLRRAVAALARTETLGASLATSTAELAASVRAARRAATTQRARTAPVKMLFPLVFLILPAFLLLTVVPVLLSTVRSIR
ncbi:MAG: tight adherence protein [Actinomycetota bacterium]|jgi:tight adherence protein C|nr:tight adherence protein [Actinomycetota bacterium]